MVQAFRAEGRNLAKSKTLSHPTDTTSLDHLDFTTYRPFDCLNPMTSVVITHLEAP